MSKPYLSAAETAALVRKSLKEAFPKVKFSVRTSSGSSIKVNWTDGPSPAQVDALVKRFHGTYFDSSIDFQGSVIHMLDGKEISIGADYLFTYRDYTDAAIAQGIEAVYTRLAGNFKRDGIERPTVEAYRNGHLYRVQLSGLHHNGMQNVQQEIRAALDAHTYCPIVQNSPTAARLMVIGDDAYSRRHGSGVSAVPAELAEGSPAQVLAEDLIERVRR